jgi:hypothetical protein
MLLIFKQDTNSLLMILMQADEIRMNIDEPPHREVNSRRSPSAPDCFYSSELSNAAHRLPGDEDKASVDALSYRVRKTDAPIFAPASGNTAFERENLWKPARISRRCYSQQHIYLAQNGVLSYRA